MSLNKLTGSITPPKTQHSLLNSSSSPSSEQTEIPQTSFLSELKAKTSYKETPVFKKINQQNGGEIDLSGLELVLEKKKSLSEMEKSLLASKTQYEKGNIRLRKK